MISDFDVNFVYFSDLLPKRFPNEFIALISILEKLEIEYGLLPNTKDIWCRDYMPIQVSENKFVSFRYEPDYLLNKDWKHTITDSKKIFDVIGINPVMSDLKIDGGNIIKHTNKVILTDKIYSENPEWDKVALVEELHNLLDAEIIIIPREPNELTGHADGMLRFKDSNTVFVNDYRLENKNLYSRIEDILNVHGLNAVPFEYFPENTKNKHGDYTALGLYINFLQIGNHFIVPTFSREESPSDRDFDAIQTIAGHYADFIHPRFDIVTPFYSYDLAMEGGLLNCISWTIKKTR